MNCYNLGGHTNYISDKFVMRRSGFSTLTKMGVDFLFLGIIVAIRKKIQFVLTSWTCFFVGGIILTIVLLFLVMGIHFLIYPEFRDIFREKNIKK